MTVERRLPVELDVLLLQVDDERERRVATASHRLELGGEDGRDEKADGEQEPRPDERQREPRRVRVDEQRLLPEPGLVETRDDPAPSDRQVLRVRGQQVAGRLRVDVEGELDALQVPERDRRRHRDLPVDGVPALGVRGRRDADEVDAVLLPVGDHERHAGGGRPQEQLAVLAREARDEHRLRPTDPGTLPDRAVGDVEEDGVRQERRAEPRADRPREGIRAAAHRVGDHPAGRQHGRHALRDRAEDVRRRARVVGEPRRLRAGDVLPQEDRREDREADAGDQQGDRHGRDEPGRGAVARPTRGASRPGAGSGVRASASRGHRRRRARPGRASPCCRCPCSARSSRTTRSGRRRSTCRGRRWG